MNPLEADAALLERGYRKARQSGLVSGNLIADLTTALRDRSAAIRSLKQDVETLCREALRTDPKEWGSLFSAILEVVHPDDEDDLETKDG